MELDFRKCRILAAIIESYIDTGEPVGSKALAEMLGNCVSSATIRNDMAALTLAGYLTQPHTSAGRLPTAAALRFYVDELMDRRPLTLQDKVDIKAVLATISGDGTRLLEDACRALADFTGLMVFAGCPEGVGSRISRVDVMQTSPRNLAVVLVQDNGFIRTRMCRCQRDIPSKITVALTEYLSRRFQGEDITAVTVAAMQEIMLELGEAGLAVAPILSAFYELAQESERAKLAVAGPMNLMRHPDYSTDQARRLTTYMADRANQQDLLEQMAPDQRVQVFIGNDDDYYMGGSCMILARYSLGQRGQGTIGVLGPNRMNYAEAIPRIEYFAAHLGRMMSELFDETAALDV
ncbi:MAG: heat-inducible transcription repressor HrcA [Ruminococcaceae bacterium]|nr:heat-inducible transcription repressor HrcA [Oscillospiraceae bacterium]